MHASERKPYFDHLPFIENLRINQIISLSMQSRAEDTIFILIGFRFHFWFFFSFRCSFLFLFPVWMNPVRMMLSTFQQTRSFIFLFLSFFVRVFLKNLPSVHRACTVALITNLKRNFFLESESKHYILYDVPMLAILLFFFLPKEMHVRFGSWSKQNFHLWCEKNRSHTENLISMRVLQIHQSIIYYYYWQLFCRRSIFFLASFILCAYQPLISILKIRNILSNSWDGFLAVKYEFREN